MTNILPNVNLDLSSSSFFFANERGQMHLCFVYRSILLSFYISILFYSELVRLFLVLSSYVI